MGKMSTTTATVIRIASYTIGIGLIDTDFGRWWIELVINGIGCAVIAIVAVITDRHEAN